MLDLLHLGAGDQLEGGKVDKKTLGASLPAPLRPYQWEGVRFLLDKETGLLADEMGLGKTVQVAVALSMKLKTSHRRRSLVVAPASLRLNWARELARWAPDISVGVVQGGSEDRRAYYMLPYNVLIASYEQIRADFLRSSNATEYDVVVLDEAQRIKNANSETALACRVLRRDASWALTGTPLENRVGDLVGVYRFVCPGLLTSAMSRPEMHTAMQPFFLRRRKYDVLRQLPPIQFQDVYVELEGQQKQAYDALWESRVNLPRRGGSNNLTSSMLALITRLKQVCNFDPVSGESSKREALGLIIDGLVSADHKLLVFSQYVTTLQWLAQEIAGSATIDIIHGGLPERDKDSAVSRFNNEPGPRVLLVSLKAGGVGLNLGEASHVVLFDRWWNPAVEEQAIHRAHRFERERVLHVFRFLVANSIEDRIFTILGKKKELFEQYVEAADSSPVPSFSGWELENVLDLGQFDTSLPDC
ncbi:MAG: DEAD/DEAH box helicase [Caldilineaceae bacterium]|nr:DEAD/DEAH box helicase [Caldilineaceae bacterium]